MTDPLDTHIRILVTELMDSAPQAPSITDIDLLQARRSIDSESRRPHKESRRGPLTSGGWSRDRRWVIAVPIVIAVLVLVLTLGFGSRAPSDAMVLEGIRSSPNVAATLSQTVHSTALESSSRTKLQRSGCPPQRSSKGPNRQCYNVLPTA